jgi:hypothetical protein
MVDFLAMYTFIFYFRALTGVKTVNDGSSPEYIALILITKPPAILERNQKAVSKVKNHLRVVFRQFKRILNTYPVP